MVKIRLRRTGAKKKPTYRLVVADARSPRDGRFIEIIGHYNPRTSPVTVKLHEDRALYWLSVGAQPTDRVQKLMTNIGTMDKLAKVKAGTSIEDVLNQDDNDDVEITVEDAVVAADPVSEIVLNPETLDLAEAVVASIEIKNETGVTSEKLIPDAIDQATE